MNEREEQKAIFSWAKALEGKYPELKLLFHVANERKCTPSQGAEFKAMGVKRGVPDIWLPIPKNGYHGLVLELKTRNGKVSIEQRSWIEALNDEGYMALVVWGFEMAVSAIENYMTGKVVERRCEGIVSGAGAGRN